MKKLPFIFAIFAIFMFFSLNALAKDRILAEVGNYKLYEKDVEKMIEEDVQIQQLLKSKPELKDEIVFAIVNRWVNLSLLALAGKKEGIDKDLEIKKELIEIEKNLIAKEYFEEKTANLKISENQLKEYYNKNKEKYKEEEGRHVKHILIYVPQDADSATKEKSLEKAKEIRKKLLKGAKFEEIAQKYSDDTGSKKKGGDLGIIRKGQTIPEFEKEIFDLKLGEISQPIKSPYGYHIIKVEEIIPERIPSFEEIKNLVKQDYMQEKKEEIMAQILQKLYEEYQPKIYLKLNRKEIQNEGK
ncbi:MAG: peptidylprolyl isomerase [Thermodesulfobacterium sp.]|nr:peptidylprolyl isomerase [Thermodesulfobacterium sp.]